MATLRIPMRNIREILRLRLVARLSLRQIARSCQVSLGAVQRVVSRAEAATVDEARLTLLSDSQLNSLIYPPPESDTGAFQFPDCAYMHQELKRKGVTKQLLWDEYVVQFCERAYRYSQFCEHYRRWLKRQKRSMRQTHRAGEKCFIDYCGHTVPIINGDTGEIREAQIFVGVLGASNYTFAEATWSQKLPDWLGSHVRMFEFFGGVPEVAVPDNLRSGVSAACRYDPDLNPSYQQLAAHYDVAVIPARPYKPKDKSKAEVAVQIVERWILAALRKQRFFSLGELNGAIKELLKGLNHRPFKRLPGNRIEAFTALDQPQLRSLPKQRYAYVDVKRVKVNIDYHVQYRQHHYSVPHHCVGEVMELHASESLVTIYLQGNVLATHPRKHTPGTSTNALHMPERHQQHHKWSPERLEKWAQSIGVHTWQWVNAQLTNRAHPEQAYRVCLGLLSLSRDYPNDRLDAACAIANDAGLIRLKAIKNILINRRDQGTSVNQLDLTLPQQHANVRGAKHFQ